MTTPALKSQTQFIRQARAASKAGHVGACYQAMVCHVSRCANCSPGIASGVHLETKTMVCDHGRMLHAEWAKAYGDWERLVLVPPIGLPEAMPTELQPGDFERKSHGNGLA